MLERIITDVFAIQINITIATKNSGNGHTIDIHIPRIKQPIPIFIAFRALGIISDKEIIKYILLDVNQVEKKECCMD